MVIIFSRTDDGSTTFVAKWLTYFKKKYVILNSDDDRNKFVSFDVNRQELIFRKKNFEFNLLHGLSSIWDRRSGLSMKSINVEGNIDGRLFFDTEEYQTNHRNDELRCLLNYIHLAVTNKSIKHIGAFKYNDVNKMEILSLAKNIGLDIPESYILSRKSDLLKLINRKKGKCIITKALGQGVYRFTDEYGYYSYVERITSKNLTKISETFFPSLFQVEIKKAYELRVFYFNKKCYSMAIFSQKNTNTKIDFRKPNLNKPDNRKVPYRLPKDMEAKIIELMDELHLNTGSIDILVDLNGKYIFLEVNPVGQFSMTSKPCNYYLEKKIAEYL